MQKTSKISSTIMCPKITIIVPIYNAEKYLRSCLDSIISQNYTSFEAILIDDGSSDSSGSICEEYVGKDKRLHVFHQPNSGVCVARNIGLEHSKGEWITFVDADDFLLPEALEQMGKVVSSDLVDLVLASTKVMNNNEISPLYTYNSQKYNDVLTNIGHAALWGYLFKTAIIQQNNIRFIPGLAYSEDKVFLLSVAERCRSLVTIPSYVYIYRRNDGSACASHDGVLKASHQFRAAHEVWMQTIATKNETNKIYLKKCVKQLKKMGYFAYARYSFSLYTYPAYEKQFLKYFNGRAFLLYKTLEAFLIIRRRKLISINDNPLTGKKGFKTKINCLKSFFKNRIIS